MDKKGIHYSTSKPLVEGLEMKKKNKKNMEPKEGDLDFLIWITNWT